MNIANKITTVRVLLIPVFILLLVLPLDLGQVNWLNTEIPVNQLLAGIVFAIASSTDYVDGYLARKHHLVTSFGEFFDPMADKLLVMAALILLVEAQVIWGWTVFIILGRELMVTGLRVLLAQTDGKVMAAKMPGKIKTLTQMFAIVFYLFNDIGFSYFNIPIANILYTICLIFTVYSGFDYFYQARFLFKDL
ncbi:CDP-diacylglycerol--glycerol-3-phosphate 3-phosphatidyltransferase [Fundicoccus sp. Sow4_H7]|uniref:CDP-diacylglycerol--glycerol-3-phosphate 3-phosphatidyltransferase n=1 Tax=Fundicoccus sp. Sow4_H7 TaxID=3438784 RepID=UPI003F8E63CC